MPSTIALLGTTTTPEVPGGTVSGTSLADRSALSGYDLTGTTTTTYADSTAWLAERRWTRVRVLMDGEDVKGIVGKVTISRSISSLHATASFSVVDPYASFFVPGSIVRGSVPIVIELTSDDGSYASTWTAFTGTLESVSTSEAYCPLATIEAVSSNNDLAVTSNGCISVAPYAGETRSEILSDYALSSGVTLYLTGVDLSVVRKPVNLSGVSIETLIFRYAEVEDRYVRETEAGTLEWLSKDQVVDAAPKFDLTEDRYQSLREDIPNRPVTSHSIGGTQISDMLSAYTGDESSTVIETGTDLAGPWRKETYTHRRFGVTMSEVIVEWKTFALKGTSAGATVYQLSGLTSTQYNYGTVSIPIEGYGLVAVPTGQLNSIWKEVRGWYSPPCNSAAGYTWTDGTQHADTSEVWSLISMDLTGFNYASITDPLPCRQTGSSQVLMGYYDALGTGFTYPDGSIRQGGTYTWQEVGRVEERHSDNITDVETGKTAIRYIIDSKTTLAFIPTGFSGGNPVEAYGVAEDSVVQLWGLPGQTYTVKVIGTRKYDGSTFSSRENVPGPMPDPVIASSLVPQYSMVPMQTARSVWTDVFPLVTATETNDDAESVEELDRVLERRIRSGLAVRYTIVGPAIRGILPWDVVQIWDRARRLGYSDAATPVIQTDGKAGWVESVSLNIDPLNGWLGQELVVAVPQENT